ELLGRRPGGGGLDRPRAPPLARLYAGAARGGRPHGPHELSRANADLYHAPPPAPPRGLRAGRPGRSAPHRRPDLGGAGDAVGLVAPNLRSRADGMGVALSDLRALASRALSLAVA